MAGKKGRGFAGMDDAKKREIASKGGKAAHQKGTAHEFTTEEARAAGRKGGQAAHQKGTAHRFTPEEARAAGRKGGQAAHQRTNLHPSLSEGTVQPTINHNLKNGGPATDAEKAGQEPISAPTIGREETTEHSIEAHNQPNDMA
jgi:general stress protein YciG